MKPRLLDLFCGAGGCSVGYARAGFEVVGVDIRDQPNYPFEFHQADALMFPLKGFDAIHASPPCQGYANVTLWRGSQNDHPRYIEQTRDRLNASGVPWVMENVRTKALRPCMVLCGSMFGLPVRRHRGFETNWGAFQLVPACQHKASDLAFMHKGERAYADAMGCGWMTSLEGREAIPPAYAEFIGGLLMFEIHARAAA